MQMQYEKYKEPIKKWCILQVISCGTALLAAILLIFVPNFSIDLMKVTFTSTTLPKLFDMNEVLFGSGRIDFSVFDEIMATFKPAGDETTTAYVALTSGLFQLLGVIFLGVGLIMCLVALVRGISHILSPDDYVLQTYDEWKRKVDKKSNRAAYLASPTYWIIVGFIYEIFAIFFSKYLSNLTDEKILTSYFTAMSGLSAGGFFTILVMIGTVVIVAVASSKKKKIKMDILKEEYASGRAATEETQRMPQGEYLANGQRENSSLPAGGSPFSGESQRDDGQQH